jgi:deoxyribodipyrimidine photo-lyase
MTKKYKTSIFLFTRDLRIVDNNGLEEAHKLSENILPVFIFTNEQIDNEKNKFKSNKSVQFLIESLDNLDVTIEKQGGKLLCFYGNREKILSYLINKFDCDAIFCNEDYTPYAKKRKSNIETLCNQISKQKGKDIKFHYYFDVCLYEPGTIKTGNNDYYQKFTPFYNVCLKENVPQPKNSHRFSWFSFKNKDKNKHTITEKKALQNTITINDAYIRFTEPSIKSLLEGGRDKGLEILKTLTQHSTYGKDRNILIKPTTHLSAYLKYGCISTRETFYTMKKHFGLKSDLVRQLIWRDFYLHIVDGFPRVLQGKSLKEKYDAIKWENNTSYINAWKNGKTGFPIVDACMRQLNITGYMHNRGRLIVSSFLIKILLVDWRVGEKYFAQNLIDYDPASNNGNWQWVSGSGADSQPYFRIFNPWTQGEKHDENAEYIKKWIPELETVNVKHIHAWDKYCEYDEYTKINYPKPIVNYSSQREKAIVMYKKYV